MSWGCILTQNYVTFLSLQNLGLFRQKKNKLWKEKGSTMLLSMFNPISDGLSDSVAPVGEILWLQPAKYQGRSPFRHHDNDATDKLLSCTFRAYMQTFGRKFPIVLSEISEFENFPKLRFCLTQIYENCCGSLNFEPTGLISYIQTKFIWRYFQ